MDEPQPQVHGGPSHLGHGLRPARPEEHDSLKLPFYLSQPQACAYLEPRESQSVFSTEPQIDPSTWENLLAHGFRRSGQLIYRPHCPSCQDCIATRVPVRQFKPSKSQRRCRRKNDDLSWKWQELSTDDEHMELYSRYQDHQHAGTMSADADGYLEMFTHSSIEVQELQFRLHDKLVGVSILDRTPLSLSSVYFYFDPDFSDRSLGTFSALMEIEEAQKMGLLFWYIGFLIRGCSKMSYKERYQPQEHFDGERWRIAPL